MTTKDLSLALIAVDWLRSELTASLHWSLKAGQKILAGMQNKSSLKRIAKIFADLYSINQSIIYLTSQKQQDENLVKTLKILIIIDRREARN